MTHAARLLAVSLLRAYKGVLSPLLPSACRYVPTCSEYAVEAVEGFGVLRGGWMALGRLMRCHPFSSHGYDPVLKNYEPHRAGADTNRVLRLTER